MPDTTTEIAEKPSISRKILLDSYRLMCTARSMSDIYEENKELTSKYVHSTSRGHEAIQLAAGMLLKDVDYAALYYRDESILLGFGVTPYELMLQLLGKADDPFSGGRTYYAHPSIKRKGFPTVPHQSSATGMQAIPATGMAHGISYLESQKMIKGRNRPIVLCSLGDGSVTEGEVAEALQMAVLKGLPIVYLVQDNNWGISARGNEMRAMDAYEYALGFKGLERLRCDGSNFEESYLTMAKAYEYARKKRKPILVHATCQLLGHHTSGVRKEFYRDEKEIKAASADDPLRKLEIYLVEDEVKGEVLAKIKTEARKSAEKQFRKAKKAKDPDVKSFDTFEFIDTPIVSEKGVRKPAKSEKILMVDAALHAIDEILKKHPEALLYGQDVGKRLGGVFREAATLGAKYGDHRVFNTPIQEAYIVGSTVGMSAVGARPFVEIQFADYIWPGINQLVEEISKSCYLTLGKFPVSTVIRVPIGAYGGGGPYHSGSVESALLTIKGIKIAYPSNAADMKGLMKSAYYDPNPVVMLEHKGLYWSKVPGTAGAKTYEPDADYVLPFGKANIVQKAADSTINTGESAVVITYGMGVYWALEASKNMSNKVEIIDLRSLNPLDYDLLTERVSVHGRALIVTEEPLSNSFAESIAGRLNQSCFSYLDAPVMLIGAADLPAVPLNIDLEKEMLPSADKVRARLEELLSY